MSGLTSEERRAIIFEVYRQADEMDWDGLSDRQHSEIYDRWLDEPAIGGQLTRFQTRERARVWLKDGPMKEYGRARNGIGVYADLAWTRFPSAGQIASIVLGKEWHSLDSTLVDRPNRCIITNGREERLMTWGPPRTLRDMVWAGINAIAEREPAPILLVSVPHERMLDEGEKRRHVLLGEIASLEVRHVVLKAIRVPTMLYSRSKAYSAPIQKDGFVVMAG